MNFPQAEASFSMFTFYSSLF